MTETTSRQLSALPGRAWIVYGVIEEAHNKGRRFGKLAELAAEAGVSYATASRAIKDLVAGRFIEHPKGWPQRSKPTSDQHAPPASHRRPARSGTEKRHAKRSSIRRAA